MFYFDFITLGVLIYLNLVTNLFFDAEKKVRAFDRHVIFAQYFDHIWPAILYRAWSRAGQRPYDSKYLNEVYKAYGINHFFCKKLIVKPNWVNIRQIPPDLTLIWKLGPDRVKFEYLQSSTVYALPI